MKMSLLILCLGLIVPLTNAVAKPMFMIDPVIQPSKPGAPVRQAKMKVAVKKMTFEQQANGSYAFREEVVCNAKIWIDVYDLRQSPDQALGVLPQVCTSTIGNEPVDISIGGIITLAHDAPFPGEASVDLKFFNAFMWVSSLGPTTPEKAKALQDGLSQSSWTRDLNQKYFGARLDPPVFTMCSTQSEPVPMPMPNEPVSLRQSLSPTDPTSQCTTNYPEFISAQIEIED